jgi:hypothetical protein
MSMIKLEATFSRPADNNAYQTGDIIANSTTAASVVPITFALPSDRNGKLIGARCVVTPASGNLVITALDFDLLLFRPADSIPFAAAGYPADNAQMSITAAGLRELVGVFTFAAGAWRNPLGALTAGATGWQAVAPTTRTLGYSFNVGDVGSSLIGVVQAKGAWTPTGIVNRFDFVLDCEITP